MSQKQELYTKVTARIVEALESGAADPNGWHAPWHASPTSGLPVNAETHKHYRGVNVVLLWSEQFMHGYSSNEWATYNAWKRIGAQVRLGQHGTKVLLWKPTKRKGVDDNGDPTTTDSLYTTSYTVFNADQVDGYEPDVVEPKSFDAVEHAEQFFAALGANVRHGGDRAFYSSAADVIQLPNPEDFDDNVSYYATSAHEHVHWTGHESRLHRDLQNRFGSESYAAEELVAEIGAAYVSALLGLTSEPRADHAHYVANWIALLKSDPSAIVTAASKAQAAVDWLVQHANVDAEVAAA